MTSYKVYTYIYIVQFHFFTKISNVIKFKLKNNKQTKKENVIYRVLYTK